MKLKELLQGVEILESTANMELNIKQVAYDSRKVEEGALFVAVSGFATDGNRFIPMAMERGAAVVVTASKPALDVPYILVRSDRLALAQIGCNYFGNPAKNMCIIGVTGTNGKTSVTLLLKQVLESIPGTKVGLVGTMGDLIGDVAVPSNRTTPTTPESFELQSLFAKMRDAGCTHVVMEVSSHAIALERVGGVHFDVAAFTNLTEDHLDFHKTMENYCDTKAQLFKRCDKAVLNQDDAYFARIRANAECAVLTTSVANGDLVAEDVQLYADGVSFIAVTAAERAKVSLPIPGRFTVCNALTVLGIALQLGISLADSAKALANAAGVKGRIEVVPTPGKDFTVLIDYAHTPDGLEKVLTSVRDFCKGRLIAVFGCGGDRDPIKRPVMGAIGTKLSDIAVITSDNPRTEVPMAIIEDILQGITPDMGEYVVIEDRKKAIAYAMDIAQKDDMIVLAGKGHETYQEIHGIKHHLDEREVVAQYLSQTEDT